MAADWTGRAALSDGTFLFVSAVQFCYKLFA